MAVDFNIKFYKFFRGMAFVGIIILAFIAILSTISIAGRSLGALGLKPVPGDFELVEMATALAIFCFMPWTHLRRGHATVDLFWGSIPANFKKYIAITSDLLMLFVWCVLIWQMSGAMQDYYLTHESTMVLLIPLFWGYAFSMVPGCLGLFAYLWKLLETLDFVSVPSQYCTDTEVVH